MLADACHRAAIALNCHFLFGIPQGSVLGPKQFVAYMEELMETLWTFPVTPDLCLSQNVHHGLAYVRNMPVE